MRRAKKVLMISHVVEFFRVYVVVRIKCKRNVDRVLGVVYNACVALASRNFCSSCYARGRRRWRWRLWWSVIVGFGPTGVEYGRSDHWLVKLPVMIALVVDNYPCMLILRPSAKLLDYRREGIGNIPFGPNLNPFLSTL
jgi:hypothetical protein